MSESARYAFGPFLFDPLTGELTREGRPVPLTFQAAEVLRFLIQRRDSFASREDLLSECWDQDRGSDESLSVQVREIRKALGDTEKEKQYVLTLRGRGYKFLGPVVLLPRVAPAVPPAREERGQPATIVAGGGPEPTVGRAETPAVAVAVHPVAARFGEDSPKPVPAFSVRRSSRISTLGVGLAAIVGTLVFAASFTVPGIPRVAGTVALTTDGLPKAHLRRVDAGSLVMFTRTSDQQVVRTDGRPVQAAPLVEGFQLLDVHRGRREALAIRPSDRGGEDGLWIVGLESGAVHRLGTIRIDGYAVWSNSGDRVAYVGDGGLFVADRATGAITSLATMAGRVTWPRWSPDDRTIRFTLDVRSDRTFTADLFEVDVERETVRRVIETPSSHARCCGEWLRKDEYVFLAGVEVRKQVWLLREATNGLGRPRQEQVQLTDQSGGFESLVPGEHGRVVFAIKSSHPALVRFVAARREFEPYLGGINAHGVAFSRDGRWVSYIKDGTALWRARPDGSEARALTAPPFEVSGASWSPDGTLLAARGRMPGQRSKVYLVPAEGGPPVPLDGRDAEQGIPSWSADGRRLTFGDVPEQWGAPTGTERIHLYDLATKTMDDVPDSANLWSSRWSPDGRYILALTIDRQELRVFDTRTLEWRRLPVRHANHPAWSADSNFIYMDPEGAATALRRVRVSDGAVESILELKDYSVVWAGVTPDGSPLVLRILSDVVALTLTRD